MFRRFRAWILRVAGSFLPSRRDADLADELASHLQLHVDDNLRAGLSPDEARRQALLKLGGVELVKERVRDRRRMGWLVGLRQDVRFAARGLRRNPTFTATAIAMLALGIGVNAAMFTCADAVFFRGFRLVHDNTRILYIGEHHGHGCCLSYPDFEDWRAQARSFTDMGAVADVRFALRDANGFAEMYNATRITTNGFRLLGVQPMIGRDFVPGDGRSGAQPVAILQYGFWQRRFGGDPGIIGRAIDINGAPTTIIGVMPETFSFPQNEALWVPFVAGPDLRHRGARDLWFAFGRLADGATFDGARAELWTIGRRLATAYPSTNEGWVPEPLTFGQFFVNRNVRLLYGILLGAAGLVLLIACTNLANLLLARSLGRSRETSIRIAIGAGRWHIIRQLLVESLMLSAVGGACGWWVARLAVRIYELNANPPTLAWSNRLFDYTMDGRVLAYLVGMSIVTGVVLGLAPALRLLRFDVNHTLKDGNRGTAGESRGRRMSAWMVTGEVALAMVLLIGAAVLTRSFIASATEDLGVDTGDVLAMFLNFPADKYSSPDSRTALLNRLDARLGTIPGAESVAGAASLPAGGSLNLPYELAGRSPVARERRPTLSALVITPGYFATLGARLVTGRDFNEFDGTSAMPVAIVNARFATVAWPGERAIGQRLRLFDGSTPGKWLTIVGVVSNIVQNDASRRRQVFDPVVYLPYRQRPASGMWVLVSAHVPPASLATAVRRQVHAIDPDLPIWLGPFPLNVRLAGVGYYWQTRTTTLLLLLFAGVALLLASLGLYAIVAHSVRQRTNEIGVRIAMGATSRDVVTLVLRQGLAPVGCGLAIGLAASLAVNPVLAFQLGRISPTDPIAVAAATVALLTAAVLGCLIPAGRATRVDPVVALREN